MSKLSENATGHSTSRNATLELLRSRKERRLWQDPLSVTLFQS